MLTVILQWTFGMINRHVIKILQTYLVVTCPLSEKISLKVNELANAELEKHSDLNAPACAHKIHLQSYTKL